MKLLSILLSFSLVGIAIQVRAEEVKLIKYGDGYSTDNTAYGPSILFKYARCWSDRDGRFCRAKPGYVFWVGKCSPNKKYLSYGALREPSSYSTERDYWCLRQE